MNSGVDSNLISNILMIVLVFMIVLLFILVVVYLVIKIKSNSKSEKEEKKKIQSANEIKADNTTTEGYGKQSIFNFMEFEKIEDNMIVQKKGKRYVMVIECQGVNYDLMSKVEKIGVEEGFQQFLNTLRHPIQIYIQTRTVNLEKSLDNYKKKVEEVENKYNQMVYEYNRRRESGEYSEEKLQKYNFEIVKQRNLLEYGTDLVANTEKMSKNKNVLNKKYYIVLPYFPEEAGSEKYDVEEIKNIAFSELYTKSQAIMSTLAACSVKCKILNSNELAELLYIAYNRDEAETFGLDKAINSGALDMYSTAPDVFLKKIEMLDKQIQNKAVDYANQKIEKAKSKLQQIAEERERQEEELIRQVAQIIIDENQNYIGSEVAQEAISEIEKEKGGEVEDEKVKKTTRGRKKRTTE